MKLLLDRNVSRRLVAVRLGNCRTREVESLVGTRAQDIAEFDNDPESALLILP